MKGAGPGDIIMLFVHDEFLPCNATLSNVDNISAYPIRAMSLIFESGEIIHDATFNPSDERKIRQLSIPYSVYDGLFLYQRGGVHWLWKMHQSQFPGAMLADDMGLGKTRQVSLLFDIDIPCVTYFFKLLHLNHFLIF